jgi:cysteine desulfurase/selenocysteine lyase
MVEDPPISAALSRQVRGAYAHLARRTYLDTAAVGLSFEGQGRAVAAFFDTFKSQGWDGRPGWQALNERVRARMAGWVNVPAADMAWLSNTTEGLNLAARGLSWRPGDRVVMAADEFVSVRRAFDFLPGVGAEVVAVPVAVEADREDRLLDALDARSRVLAVSHVHASTGTRVDLARLARACRERDALLVVDGVQALGAVAVDASLADVYCASHFKWMLGSFGTATFTTSARARERIAPVARGYANEAGPGYQYAHASLPGLFALDAALDHAEAVGRDTVHAQVAHLARVLMDGLAGLGLHVLTPPGAHAGIVSVACDDAAGLQQALGARGVSVAERDGLLRVSPHFYNTTDDLDVLLGHLRELAPPHADEPTRR